MYLADVDIKEKLAEMDIVCDEPQTSFNPKEQIQPCSIDLKLSNVFWVPIKGKLIDLRRSHLQEISPRFYWEKKVLNEGEHIILKPGKALYGRVCERFTMPKDCAGKIEGRSSFARMGLGVHFTADFINPGYRGYMPLQLFNYGESPITIVPHIPICQLMLVKLSNIPSRTYGEKELESKYVNDDGGPSYWWRDKRIKALQDKLGKIDKAIRIQDVILKRMGLQEPEIIERFQYHIDKQKQSDFESADTLMQSFGRSEDSLRVRDKLVHGFSYAVFPILASVSLGSLLLDSFGFGCYLVWVLTLLSVGPFVWVLKEPQKQYYGKQEIEKTS